LQQASAQMSAPDWRRHGKIEFRRESPFTHCFAHLFSGQLLVSVEELLGGLTGSPSLYSIVPDLLDE
jgi:hypothetical protein